MERLEALKIVAMLVAGYPGWRPSDETEELYATLLQPMPAEAVKTAVLDILRSRREFAPPVGVIIQAATRLELARADRPALTAEDAWALVQTAIRERGFYRDPGNLGCSAAACRAVDAIGWANLCTDENLAASRAHFLRLFDSFQQREVEAAVGLLSTGGELTGRPASTSIDHSASLLAPDRIEPSRGAALLRDAIGRIGKAVAA
jgi:hypothetical protein